jgi:hypothetical protein
MPSYTFLPTLLRKRQFACGHRSYLAVRIALVKGLSKITRLFVLKFWGLQRSPQYDTKVFLTAVDGWGSRFFRNIGVMLSSYTASYSTKNPSPNNRVSRQTFEHTSRSRKQKCTCPPPPRRGRRLTSCAITVSLRSLNELNCVCEVFVFAQSEVQSEPSLWERLFSVLCSNHDSSERSLP